MEKGSIVAEAKVISTVATTNIDATAEKIHTIEVTQEPLLYISELLPIPMDGCCNKALSGVFLTTDIRSKNISVHVHRYGCSLYSFRR